MGSALSCLKSDDATANRAGRTTTGATGTTKTTTGGVKSKVENAGAKAAYKAEAAKDKVESVAKDAKHKAERKEDKVEDKIERKEEKLEAEKDETSMMGTETTDMNKTEILPVTDDTTITTPEEVSRDAPVEVVDEASTPTKPGMVAAGAIPMAAAPAVASHRSAGVDGDDDLDPEKLIIVDEGLPLSGTLSPVKAPQGEVYVPPKPSPQAIPVEQFWDVKIEGIDHQRPPVEEMLQDSVEKEPEAVDEVKAEDTPVVMGGGDLGDVQDEFEDARDGTDDPMTEDRELSGIGGAGIAPIALTTPSPVEKTVDDDSNVQNLKAKFEEAKDELPQAKALNKDIRDPVTGEMITIEEFKRRVKARGIVDENVKKYEEISDKSAKEKAELDAQKEALESARRKEKEDIGEKTVTDSAGESILERSGEETLATPNTTMQSSPRFSETPMESSETDKNSPMLTDDTKGLAPFGGAQMVENDPVSSLTDPVSRSENLREKQLSDTNQTSYSAGQETSAIEPSPVVGGFVSSTPNLAEGDLKEDITQPLQDTKTPLDSMTTASKPVDETRFSENPYEEKNQAPEVLGTEPIVDNDNTMMSNSSETDAPRNTLEAQPITPSAGKSLEAEDHGLLMAGGTGIPPSVESPVRESREPVENRQERDSVPVDSIENSGIDEKDNLMGSTTTSTTAEPLKTSSMRDSPTFTEEDKDLLSKEDPVLPIKDASQKGSEGPLGSGAVPTTKTGDSTKAPGSTQTGTTSLPKTTIPAGTTAVASSSSTPAKETQASDSSTGGILKSITRRLSSRDDPGRKSRVKEIAKRFSFKS
eukprot:Plantae.Rhodophyta-Hildenbrandia_rubra.ctg11983.p1 GENE.Plantae.Rhodophyta-Hildenbrandia_rubra.ctg11983~~Plantae.Rhodophyta-Hildenbrandia_rubra.ctg11983.p1  ORF type:complete len:816 (-),score=219.45 Plantae.Rhodophyta-Hildenbrandia_rubra.ctg11983:882-3329(-)